MKKNFIKMSNKILLYLVFIFSFMAFLPAVTADAADLFKGSKDEACVAVDASAGGKCSQEKLDKGSTDLSERINKVVDVVSVLVGIIAVIMIIIAGLRYVTSNGDSGSVGSAKNTLLYAVVGLIVVAFAQTIVKFVLNRIYE